MTRRPWTAQQDLLLTSLYPDSKTARLTELLERSERAIYSRAEMLGLKKSAEFLASEESGRYTGREGLNTRFKPGHKTWNKGANYVAGGRSAETRFKAGQKPHTWRPIGTERITKEGYLQRKIADTGYTPRDYVCVHHLLWIEHNGAIPDGHRVVFINRDKTDIRIENLELVSIADLMRRNTIHRYPAELRDVMRVAGRVRKAIERRDEKQDQ